MKNKQFKYIFSISSACEMCGEDNSKHKILGQRLNQSQGLNPRNKIGIATTVLKCTNCNLIYSNPQPIPNNIEDHYEVPAEDYWKPSYFIIDDNVFANELSIIKKLLPNTPNKKALDIGAGIGKCMAVLEREQFETYGIEPSAAFRQKAIEKLNINPERLIHIAVEDASYPENYFDFITFGAVLEHLPFPGKAIENAIKWLKPNGIIQIEVPSARYLISKLLNLYFRLRATTFVTNLSPMHNPYHLYEFDLTTFEKNAKINNYEVAFYQYHVCPVPYFPSFLKPLVAWIMRKTNTGLQLSVYLRKK